MNTTTNLDYERPVEITENIWWIGFHDRESNLHCNPYLMLDGDEAVVIDGGSRPDFPTVMMKILQTGIDPSQIKSLIYHHYDPDLCGSIPNFEDIIGGERLKIVTDEGNAGFIRHYMVISPIVTLASLGYRYSFSSGRSLRFIPTPYCHSAGSFMTFDERSGILFTSDIFGSFSVQWELFAEFSEECSGCGDFTDCPNKRSHCPYPATVDFHRKTMPNAKALRHALRQVRSVPFRMLAPQHGSIIRSARDAETIICQLEKTRDIGIDAIVGVED